jgi:hypothetical protein
MLNLAGRKPVMLTFDEGVHGWEDVDQLDKAYTGIAGFLEKYLGAPGAPAASTSAPTVPHPTQATGAPAVTASAPPPAITAPVPASSAAVRTPGTPR